MKQFNLSLVSVTILLVFINIYAISFLELDTQRWVRFLSFGVFLMFLLKKLSLKDPVFTSAVALLFLSDICFIHYEISVFSRLFFIIGILGYSMLLYHISPELRNFEFNLFQKVLFGAVLSFDMILLIMLADMIPNKFNDPILLVLFFLYGLIVVFLKIAAVVFSNRYANRASFFFTCAVLGLVFSDLTLFMAYYVRVPEFYYPSIVFYLLGIASLVKFSRLDKEESEFLILEQ